MLSKSEFTDQERITALEYEIALWKLLFSDGNVGFYANDISYRYATIAIIYAKTENTKNYKGNACNLRLSGLTWKSFDFIRNEVRFKKVEETLKKYAESF